MELSQLLCMAFMALYPQYNEGRIEKACSHFSEVVRVAEERSIDPALMVSLIHHESAWNPRVISRANACGLTQVIPKWTGGRATSGRKYTCEQLLNPQVSIPAGTEILSFWIRHYGKGNIKKGLCGYNAGYRCEIDQRKGKGVGYANKVYRTSRRLRALMKNMRE